MKLIHWVLCGSAAALGCALLPATPAHRVGAQAPPDAPAPAAAPAATPAAVPAAAPAEEKPIETVLRSYDVGDLVHVIADRPLGPAVLPPTQLNGGYNAYNGRSSTFSSNSNRQVEPPTDQQRTADLVKFIQDDVSPDSWRENGGQIGSIHTLESTLFVRQTADNQKKVAEFLDLLRKGRQSARTVTVQADWLWLNPGELAQVTRGSRPNAAAREVDLAAVHKLGPRSLYAHGQITCAGGQTVHLLSGRAKTYVENLTAAVGTGAAAYQPEVDEILHGAALQVTPNIQGESAVVDVLGTASGWGDQGEPYRFLAVGSAAEPSDRPGGKSPGGAYDTVATMDRLNVVAHQFSTTARLPLGKPIVIGGMTLEPEGSGGAAAPAAGAPGAAPGSSAAAGGAAKAADGRQLYLVLRVDAE